MTGESAETESKSNKPEPDKAPNVATSRGDKQAEEETQAANSNAKPKHEVVREWANTILLFLAFTAAGWAAYEANRLGNLTDQLLRDGHETSSQQAEFTRESLKTNKEAIIASSRAWVGPRNAKLEAAPELNKALDLTIEYQNTGREPARNFTFRVDTFTATHQQDQSGFVAARLSAYQWGCEQTRKLEGGGVVYPTTGFTAYNLHEPLKAELIDEAFIGGEKSLIIQGCFLYKTFETVRRSYFCYFYVHGRTKIANLSICRNGHYAD